MGHPAFPSSAAQQGVDLDDRGVAGVDGVDDLGVVDALEVDRRDVAPAPTFGDRVAFQSAVSRR